MKEEDEDLVDEEEAKLHALQERQWIERNRMIEVFHLCMEHVVIPRKIADHASSPRNLHGRRRRKKRRKRNILRTLRNRLFFISHSLGSK